MNFLDQNGLSHYTKKINSKILANGINIYPSTKELFDLPATATLDQILQKIAEINQVNSGKVAVYITIKTTDGIPVPDCAIQKCTTITGQPIFTGSDGTAIGYVESSKLSKGLSIWNHLEFEDLDFGLVVKNGIYTAEAILTKRNFLSITASSWWYASKLIKRLDVSVGGGGGGGGTWYTSGSVYSAGGGGGGGYTASKENAPFATRQELEARVGAGGSGAKQAQPATSTPGGVSSFLGVSANGGGACQGNSGTGNGNGGSGAKFNTSTFKGTQSVGGTNGTQYIYTSFTAKALYGGGGPGGGGQFDGRYYSPSVAGSPHGTGGGGDGGELNYSLSSVNGYPGGDGKSGVVTVRIYF